MRPSAARLSVPLVLGILFGYTLEPASENLTMTTSYPSPAGIYRQLVTTGQTLLARNTGNVGIGTTLPAAKLDVAGGGRIGGPLEVLGRLRVADGTQGTGKVLTSDATGRASWTSQAPLGGISTYNTGIRRGWYIMSIGAHSYCALSLENHVWANQACICHVYPSSWNGQKYVWTLAEGSDPGVPNGCGCGAVCLQ